MTTRSIILSPHEVRAALEDRLGLVVRPVKGLFDFKFVSARLSSFNSIWGPDAWIFEMPLDKDVTGAESMSRGLQCPLGAPGTRLVCKETWACRGKHTDSIRDQEVSWNPAHFSVWYAASCYKSDHSEAFNLDFLGRWRSPATMPGWASRITLEVTGVRCVRLGDITEHDVNLAGDLDDLEPADVCATAQRYGLAMDDGRASFACAWDSKYSKRGFAWGSNPWCWVVGVRRVEGCL